MSVIKKIQATLNLLLSWLETDTTLASDSDSRIPSTKAVRAYVTNAVVGLLDYRGSYDASTNLFPATGGSGIAGAVLKGDFWTCSVAGTLGGIGATAGDLIIALADTPAQTSSNWDLIQHDVNNEYVTKALYDANTILQATTDNTPVAITIAEQQIAGRITGGTIKGLSATEVRTLINVADGANVGLPLAGGALSGALNEAKGADIASATTTDIGAATGNYVVVTGTTTITGLGTVQAGTRRIVNFSGALILTHHATALILPTGANITTVAGDTAIFISLGSGNWVCTSYQRKDGTALAAAGGGLPVSARPASLFGTTSASYVDITGVTINVVAGKKYHLAATIAAIGDAIDKVKIQIVGATSTLALKGVFVGSYYDGSAIVNIGYMNAASWEMPYGSKGNTNYIIDVIVDVSGSDGSIKMQAKNDSGGGGTMYVYVATILTLTEVS